MTLQVLLSAMYLEDYHYIDRLGITGDAIVINQCDMDSEEVIKEDNRVVDYVCSTARGLSRSRNQAIRRAGADVCILCDNDVEYVQDYRALILQSFEEYPDDDILVFFIERKERHQPVFSKSKKMNYLSVMKIFSPEIAFRRESIRKLSFQEEFGAGAKYGMGEENIFLYDALRSGLSVRYVPIRIAGLIETESTWFTGYTEKFFRDRGANYYAMTRHWYWLLIWQFAIRKRKIYQEEPGEDGKIGMLRAVKRMFDGKREYAAYENISDR